MENINLAIAGLKANKMRAILTMLGIIIGIGSVIGIITIGNSLTMYMSDSMSKMGAGNVMVIVRERDNSSDSSGPGGGGDGMISSGSAQPDESDLIQDEDIRSFEERFQDQVQSVSISYSVGTGKAKDERRYANVNTTGVTAGYADANDLTIDKGRFITDRDVQDMKNIAVVSDKLVEAMFEQGINPIGQEVKIYSSSRYDTYKVIGVYHYEDSIMTMGTSSKEDLRTNLYIPVSTAQQNATVKGYQMFTVVAKQGVDAEELTEDVKAYWDKIYAGNTKWEVGVTNMESVLKTMNDMMGTLSIAVAVIAAISLLVGGIGVMNIMLVSVTERTREIGTRKALGARSSNIRMQFIVESVIICAIGGVIGIVLGIALGALGSSLLGFPAVIAPLVAIGCMAFSMAVGVFFGYYPAGKAAKLDPIEALRYE